MKNNFDRRRFLLGVAPVATVALGLEGLAKESTVKPSHYAPTFFSAAEWSFLNAAVGRLIPAEGAGPGAVEVGVPEFIDRQMEMPYGHGAYFYMRGPFHTNAIASLGYQLRYTPREIYRLGIKAANEAVQRLHKRDFVRLAAADQDHCLGAMERNELQFSELPASVFFEQLLGNTKEGYFSDPLYGGNRGMAAWKWIGFPGARADFTDWLDQAGHAYPYGPVSISGARG
jgi:gluconate 2-dehydrogenase gamma chain